MTSFKWFSFIANLVSPKSFTEIGDATLSKLYHKQRKRYVAI